MARYNFISNDDVELVTGEKPPAPEAPSFRGADLNDLARRYAAYRELNPSGLAPPSRLPERWYDEDVEDTPPPGWLGRFFSRIASLGQVAGH